MYVDKAFNATIHEAAYIWNALPECILALKSVSSCSAPPAGQSTDCSWYTTATDSKNSATTLHCAFEN